MILQLLLVLLCAAGFAVPLADWNRRQVRFLFPFVLFSFLFVTARFFEITADTEQHALFLFRAAYAAIPFVSFFGMLFGLERFSRMELRWYHIFVATALPSVISVEAFLLSPLMFSHLDFTRPLITFTPGPLCLIWYGLEILGVSATAVDVFFRIRFQNCPQF